VSKDVLVRCGDTEFYVRVADGGGPATIGIGDALSFDGVRDTVEAIGSQRVNRHNQSWCPYFGNRTSRLAEIGRVFLGGHRRQCGPDSRHRDHSRSRKRTNPVVGPRTGHCLPSTYTCQFRYFDCAGTWTWTRRGRSRSGAL